MSFFFFLLFLGSMMAQNGENPFELVPRAGTNVKVSTKKVPKVEADTIAAEAKSAQTALDENPFALKPAASNKGKAKRRNKEKATTNSENSSAEIQPQPTDTKVRRFIFSIIILDLILVAIMLTLMRNFFEKSYISFINENLLNQVFRERQAGTLIPFLIFYVLFFYNLSLFIYLLIEHYNLPIVLNPLPTFLYILLGVSLAFFGKHLLLRIVGFIFPIDQELRKYSFTIMIFGIIIGFFLLLANLLIAYGPGSITKYIIYTSLGIITLIYLFRTLRGLFIGNKYIWFHKFHFLLYICTVEIAPAIIMWKLILNQI